MNKILILIPTYNEKGNVQNLYDEIKRTKIKADILFVDDNSPDGTAKIIKQIARKDRKVNLLSRRTKDGIGSAHLYGIHWAYSRKYTILITMDSDFTHKPTDIPKLISKMKNSDIVVGSRYLSKNSLEDWNPIRKSLTKIAHIMTTILLGLTYDATGAFRLYRIDKIPEKIFDVVESKTYSFFFESLFILNLNGFKITEISISLPARTYGNSKMKLSDVWSGFVLLIKTFYLSKIYRDSYIYAPPVVIPKKNRGRVEKEWDDYWLLERKQRKILYDAAAVFYRKHIIRQTLNRYVNKTFKKGARVLHAGCGGGQVDQDAVKRIRITALDISSQALNRYKRLYGNSCEIMYGGIFNIPAKNGSFDGIYNLGVMEHFTEKDIAKILDEFHRVLKEKGKILLFWPPEFGLSVIFLNTVHFILNDVLGKNIILHPEEITKVKSKKQIQRILAKSGFKLTNFNFGPNDLFTYTIITGIRL